MFKEANCPLPDKNWSWEEFIATLKKLQDKFPEKNVINLLDSIHHWSTFLFRFGGKIYDPENGDPIKIDYPQSIKALQSFAGLLRNFKTIEKTDNINDFPIFFSPRQNLYPYPESEINENFHPVQLPLPAGGLDTNNQAVDLLCVRKECSDIKLSKDFIKFMLSNKIQDFVGNIGYGMPIRKSSTEKLKASSESPLLKLYCAEIEKISTEYYIFSPELYRMISDGVKLSLQQESDEKIADFLHELGQALRMFLKIEDFRQK
jgi:ABC-type glycerol-3-phosphate transport system substrate-binding protein